MTNEEIAAIARTFAMHLPPPPATVPAGSDRKSTEITARIKALHKAAGTQTENVNHRVNQLRQQLADALENHVTDERGPAGSD